MIFVAQGNCNEIVLEILISHVRLNPCEVLRDQKACDGEGLGTWGKSPKVGMLTADAVGKTVENSAYLDLIQHDSLSWQGCLSYKIEVTLSVIQYEHIVRSQCPFERYWYSLLNLRPFFESKGPMQVPLH